MSVPTFTKSGAKATKSSTLDSSIFGLEVKSHSLLKQAYITYQANGRENLAKTLRRGEVRGGGKKPWKQKGTGRARFGSIRVPIWRGGGITFGPLGVENYAKKLSIASKRTAIRQALSVKKANKAIIVIEAFDSKISKTSEAQSLLNKIGARRSVLLVVSNKDEQLERATRNIKDVVVVHAMYLNVFNILNAHTLVFTQDALNTVTSWLGKETKS